MNYQRHAKEKAKGSGGDYVVKIHVKSMNHQNTNASNHVLPISKQTSNPNGHGLENLEEDDTHSRPQPKEP